ncbi:nucleotidyltransferase family protein [Salinibius halmophilus]|uniref:nucleotidyltransferase family protein n=1 Tax=Salinibius halmophilus TaxID=1853216 RepID=UPI000E673302|nr:nucleotidyltransferase family protein [Salinibius halmophilus]
MLANLDYQPTAQQIVDWIKADPQRMLALEQAATLNLPDWCIAAGFVRNLVWDKLYGVSTPLNDIDVIYYQPAETAESLDLAFDQQLLAMSNFDWSVKNQARMHIRNHDAPYTSTANAMCYWVEVQTAIGVRMAKRGKLELVAPFGVEPLFNGRIDLNPRRPKIDDFNERVGKKRWLAIWPALRADTSCLATSSVQQSLAETAEND